MVIGNGMVAKRFESYKANDEFLIFASGVSNSKNIGQEAYDREQKLLENAIKENKEKALVYFSTCSIYDPGEQDSKYVLHKKKIEKFIQKSVSQFYIFRVSNLVGQSGNPNTVLNFFIYHITHGINFDLWTNAVRNLIDIDDMYKMADHILQRKIYQNHVIDIANPASYPTVEIIKAVEDLLNIKANYISIPKGTPFNIDITQIAPITKELDLHFEKNYLPNLLRKYYFNQ
jgi:nucleoside-diphosphate-sugar epimerase